MARRGERGQLLRRTVLIAVASAVMGMPLPAQSNPDTAPPQESAAKPAESAPQQPAAGGQKQDPVAPVPQPQPAIILPPEETREAQIEAQTKELYRLSAELRAEVAKTYKDTLSLSVLKKAEQIEKLAKSLRALMTAEAADAKHKNP